MLSWVLHGNNVLRRRHGSMCGGCRLAATRSGQRLLGCGIAILLRRANFGEGNLRGVGLGRRARVAANVERTRPGLRPGGFKDGRGSLANLRHLRQVADFGLEQHFEAGDAVVNERVGVRLADAGDGRQHLHGPGDLFIEPDGRRHFGFDVHLPAGDSGRQPRILPALADGQGKLIVDHDDLDALVRLVDLEGLELRRTQGIGDEVANVGIPTDDIDLLIVELPDDVFDPLAAQADAGADRVYLFITGVDGQLRAESRFPGDALDLDGAVVDLGHFELKQLDDEVRVPAGKYDLRTVGAVLDRLDVTADALAHLVFLGRHSFAVGQQRLVLPEVDIDIRALEAPDGAADDVAHAVLELVEDHRLLRPANLLHERLLGVL